MKMRLMKTFLGVTNSGVERLSDLEGYVFVKSHTPLTGVFEVEDKANGQPKAVTVSSVFNRTLYR